MVKHCLANHRWGGGEKSVNLIKFDLTCQLIVPHFSGTFSLSVQLPFAFRSGSHGVVLLYFQIQTPVRKMDWKIQQHNTMEGLNEKQMAVELNREDTREM